MNINIDMRALAALLGDEALEALSIIAEQRRVEKATLVAARQKNAEELNKAKAVKQELQALCNHLHPDGTSRAVYVVAGDLPYFICQKLQCVIRPESQKGDPRIGSYMGCIFSDEQFNSLREAPQPNFKGWDSGTKLSPEEEDRLYAMPLDELRKLAQGE